jgi:hypothetical protein
MTMATTTTTTTTASPTAAVIEVHAWFSAETALRDGSSVYRKTGGSTVNVTRTDAVKESKGSFWRDEKYLGPVIALEHGGCVHSIRRVPSING